MLRQPRNIDQIVDEQVQRWRVERARAETSLERPRPVIAISRQYGARGAAVGHVVAERLGFSYWNRQLVDEVAQHAHVSDRLVRAFDERHQDTVIETIRSMVNNGPLSASSFFRELARIAHTIASHGAAVIVGRGVAFMLPPETTLRVRVVAPLEHRIARIVEQGGGSESLARAEIRAIDAERTTFVRDHYGVDADDPANYDLHVNTGMSSLDQAAAVIVAACHARFADQPRATPSAQAGRA